MTRARYTTNLVDWKQVEDSIFDDIIKPTQSKKFQKISKISKNSECLFSKCQNAILKPVNRISSRPCEQNMTPIGQKWSFMRSRDAGGSSVGSNSATIQILRRKLSFLLISIHDWTPNGP